LWLLVSQITTLDIIRPFLTKQILLLSPPTCLLGLFPLLTHFDVISWESPYLTQKIN
jgi:hypothetical protein